MNVFAVLLPTDPSPIVEAIQAKFPNDHLRLSATQWFVASSGTTQDVSARLGIFDAANPEAPRNGDGIVLAINNYTGYAQRSIWEWLRSKMEAPGG